MLKKLISIFSIILVYSICCIFIYNSHNSSTKNIIPNIKRNDVLATLRIDKINLNNPIYNLSDNRNNVEENVTILDESILPDNDNSIVFIAAHSGEGKIAYFNDLDKLDIGDRISFFYKNKEYKYIVSSIYEENRNGYIHVNKDDNKQLILTTCSKHKNKQLIVNCIEEV